MTDQPEGPKLSRRKLFTQLGLAAGTVYMAPAMLHLSPAMADGRVIPDHPPIPFILKTSVTPPGLHAESANEGVPVVRWPR